VPLDEFLAATSDLLAIFRAMWLAAADDPHKRRAIERAARELQAAVDLASQHEPASPEHRAAMTRIDGALNVVFNSMHFNAQLAPVVGAAAARVRRAR